MLLLLASFVICAAVGSLGAEATRVFFVALAMSTLLSAMPIAVLWFLDRRERESPWLFASAFLWGGLIATTLALPVNSTVLYFVAQWLEGNAALKEMLGPEAALMIGAPIAAPLVEETTKGLGLLLLFWLVRSEFDNVRDGFVYGALIGAGFNWFESALYVQQNFVEFGDAPFGFQLGMRYALVGSRRARDVLRDLRRIARLRARDAHPLAGLDRPARGIRAGRSRARLEQLAAALRGAGRGEARRGAADRGRAHRPTWGCSRRWRPPA